MDDLNRRFLLKCQNLDYTFATSMLEVQKDPSKLNECLNKIKDSLFDLVAFHNSYKSSLFNVSESFDKLNKAWESFVELIKKYQSKELTANMQMELGKHLDDVRVANVNLIENLNAKFI